MLGTPDAYLLPSLPGLGYLKVDTEKYVQFRAALASGPHVRTAVTVEPPQPVRVFDAARAGARSRAGDGARRRAERAAGARGPARRRPAAGPPGVGGAAAGRRAARRRARPTRRGGTAASAPRACGRWSAGSTSRPSSAPSRSSSTSPAPAATWRWSARRARARARSLRTLAASLIWRHTPAQVQLYAIDLGGGLLSALAGAPHVGGIAGKLDREAVTRVVRQLRTEVEDREQAFREAGHESMSDARGAGAFRDLFLLIDGWEAFKREFEGLDRELEELAAHRPQLRRARGRRRQPLGRDPAGAARQPRHAARAAPARRDRLAGLAPGGVRRCPPTCPGAG